MNVLHVKNTRTLYFINRCVRNDHKFKLTVKIHGEKTTGQLWPWKHAVKYNWKRKVFEYFSLCKFKKVSYFIQSAIKTREKIRNICLVKKF